VIFVATNFIVGRCTAYGDAETKHKALEAASAVPLTKPIDFGTLRSEIDMRVERAASVLLRCTSPVVAHRDRYCSASECRLSVELRKSPACTQSVAFDVLRTFLRAHPG
jgi:hypothetical protein